MKHKNNLTWLWVSLIVVALIIGGIVGAYFFNKDTSKCDSNSDCKNGYVCSLEKCYATGELPPTTCECGGVAGIKCNSNYQCVLPFDSINSINDACGKCMPVGQITLYIIENNICVELSHILLEQGLTFGSLKECQNYLTHQGCRPVCDSIGTKSEGWYDSCTNQLIKYELCSRI